MNNMGATQKTFNGFVDNIPVDGLVPGCWAEVSDFQFPAV